MYHLQQPFETIMTMPIITRKWMVKRLVQQKEREREEQEKEIRKSKSKK